MTLDSVTVGSARLLEISPTVFVGEVGAVLVGVAVVAVGRCFVVVIGTRLVMVVGRQCFAGAIGIRLGGVVGWRHLVAKAGKCFAVVGTCLVFVVGSCVVVVMEISFGVG